MLQQPGFLCFVFRRRENGKDCSSWIGGEKEKDRRWIRQRQKWGASLWQQGPDCWLLVTEEMGAGSRLGGRNQPKERSLRDPLLTPAGAV